MSVIPFIQRTKEAGVAIERRDITILQINLGKKCNQACHHCHVEAGPKRTENMTLDTLERVLLLLEKTPSIQTVDMTGGAPELNPYFKSLVTRVHAMGKQMIDRCNLTVLFEEGQEDTAQFLADHGVKIVASLPCYSKENVEAQRGNNVFDKSIGGLQLLNRLGYGRDKGLVLDLVYNPGGAFLPPEQMVLEQEYKTRLKQDFGIAFNHLYTITNMPIKRYLHYLKRENLLDDYMQLLADNFNADVAGQVMCTNMLSVNWDGRLSDCDFNQMLELPVKGSIKTIWDADSFDIITEEIVLGNHCYGCTAGAGSSCGGALK